MKESDVARTTHPHTSISHSVESFEETPTSVISDENKTVTHTSVNTYVLSMEELFNISQSMDVDVRSKVS